MFYTMIVSTLILSACSPSGLSLTHIEESQLELSEPPRETTAALLAEQQALENTDPEQLLAAPLTAQNAIKLTLRENQDIAAELQNIGIKEANLWQAGLLKNPIIELSTLFAEHASSANLTAALLTSLTDLWQKPLQQDIASHDLEIEKHRIAAVLIGKAAATHQAHLTHQHAREQKQAAATALQIAQAREKLTSELFKAGNITKLEHNKTITKTHLAVKNHLLAKAHVKETRAQLNAAMGLDGENAAQWRMARGNNRLPPLPLAEKQAEIQALTNNLGLAIAKQNLLKFAAQHQLQRQKSIIPDLDIGLEFERSDGEKEIGPLAELTIPIFDHGQAKRLKAEHQLKQLEAKLIAHMRKVALKARTLTRKRRDQNKLLRHDKHNIIPSAKRVEQGALQHYNAMQQGAEKLLAAKQQSLELQQDHNARRYQSWLTHIELKALLAGHLIKEPQTLKAQAANSKAQKDEEAH